MKNILFNDHHDLTELVILLLKDQTRRIADIPQKMKSHWRIGDRLEIESPTVIRWVRIDGCPVMKLYPRYEVGEVVAVAQSYEVLERTGFAIFVSDYSEKDAGWRNKMFVSPDAMPNVIRITGVRAERLQDISEKDCVREGVRYLSPLKMYYFECRKKDQGFYFSTAREAYSSLIDKISGKGTWESNPLVWVYDFELITNK
ncbi:MAG: hypothetical protein RR346_03825 [Bacteroidales bacterium]